jgi:hypothetical protein
MLLLRITCVCYDQRASTFDPFLPAIILQAIDQLGTCLLVFSCFFLSFFSSPTVCTFGSKQLTPSWSLPRYSVLSLLWITTRIVHESEFYSRNPRAIILTTMYEVSRTAYFVQDCFVLRTYYDRRAFSDPDGSGSLAIAPDDSTRRRYMRSTWR